MNLQPNWLHPLSVEGVSDAFSPQAGCCRHELDITGRVEGVEETVLTGSENSLKGQASCCGCGLQSRDLFNSPQPASETNEFLVGM